MGWRRMEFRFMGAVSWNRSGIVHKRWSINPVGGRICCKAYGSLCAGQCTDLPIYFWIVAGVLLDIDALFCLCGLVTVFLPSVQGVVYVELTFYNVMSWPKRQSLVR